MSNLKEARARWRSIDSKTKKIRPIRTVLSGDGRGNAASNLYVAQDERFVYVREFGSEKFFIVKNSLGAAGPFVDLPLVLGYDDRIDTGEEVVLSVNYEGIPDGTAGSTTFGMGKHANQHQFRGGDEVYIDSRLFLPGDVVPTVPATMFLEVRSLTHNNNGQQRWVSGSTVDLTTYLPTGLSNVFLSISLDPSTNTLSYTEGVPFVATSGSFTFDQFFNNASVINSAGGFSDIPTPPLGNIPLAAVALNASTTRVDWASAIDNLTDMRVFLQPPPDAASVTGGNLGTGIPVFREKSGTTLNFRTFVGGSGVNISSATSVIQIHASGVMLQGSALLNSEASEGNALTWNSTASQWSAASISAGGGGAGGSVNLGTGIEVLHEIAGGSTQMRTLISGDNITISSSTSAVTIMAVDNSAASLALAPVGASLFATLASEINDGALVNLNWQEGYDTHGFFNTASADRLTIPTGQDGIYLYTAQVPFSTNTTGNRTVHVQNKNGDAYIGSQTEKSITTGIHHLLLNKVFALVAGDELVVQATQDSGIGLSITNTASYYPSFTLQKIAEHPSSSTLIAQGAVGACLFSTLASEINTASNIHISDWQVGYDTHGFFSSGSLDRLIIPEGEAGIYAITGKLQYSANSTGRRFLYIKQMDGGVNYHLLEQPDSTDLPGTTILTKTAIAELKAGAEIVLMARQDSGVGLSLVNFASIIPALTIQKLAELPGLAPTRLITGDNKGTGIEVYREKSGGSLQFRTLAPGAGVNISSAASLVTIESSAAPSANTVGTTAEVFREIESGTTLNFRSITGGAGITATEATSIITIATSANNISTTREVFREIESGNVLNFRTLAPGPGVNITQATSVLTIEASTVGGNSLGTGIEIFREVESGDTLSLRSITGDDLISITSATSLITVAHGDHGARVFNSAASEVNNTVWTSVGFQSERRDTDAFHDNVTNKSRMTIPTGLGGIYAVGGHLAFGANSTGRRHLRIQKGGSTTLAEQRMVALTSVATVLDLHTVTHLNDSEYVEIQIWQSSGAGLSILAGGDNTQQLSDMYIQKLA